MNETFLFAAIDKGTGNESNRTLTPQSSGSRVEFIAVLSCLAAVGLLILLANSLVFLLFLKRRYLRTKTNYFLLSLALSDCLVGGVCIPLVIACSTASQNRLPICISMDLLQRCFAFSTILHLMGATFERFIKLTRPFSYNTTLTTRRVLSMIVGIWTFSVFASFIQLCWISINENHHTSSEMQHLLPTIEVSYSSVCLAMFVVFPIISMSYIYKKILSLIKKKIPERIPIRKSTSKKANNEKRIVIVYSSLIATFFFGWTSYFCGSLYEDMGFHPLDIPPGIWYVLMFMKFSTALVNPLIYTFFKRDFQKAFQETIGNRIPCLDCSQKADNKEDETGLRLTTMGLSTTGISKMGLSTMTLSTSPRLSKILP